MTYTIYQVFNSLKNLNITEGWIAIDANFNCITEDDIIKAIETYEPRAKVLSVSTKVSPDNHEVRASVTFQVINTLEESFVEISLTRLR